MRARALIFFFLITAQVTAQETGRYPKPFLDDLSQSELKKINVAGSKTLQDIISHSPPGYTDSDPITSGHESTHGACSRYRNQKGASGRSNAFYLLNGRVEVYTGPNTTLSQVTSVVPQQLRGQIFSLYVVQQQRYWNNEPLYLMEEMVCYKHGSMIRYELGMSSRRGETVAYTLEMMVYSICMMRLGEGANEELQEFMAEQIYHIAEIYHQNKSIGGIDRAIGYLEKIKNDNGMYKYIDELTNKFPQKNKVSLFN